MKNMLTPWKVSYDQPRQHIKKQRHYFSNKVTFPSSPSCGFSSGRIRVCELDYKESWAPKNWCFWTLVLEKTLESPLDCKEIKTVILKKAILNIHWKDWYWSWSSNTLATWCEDLTHWKRPWWWESLKAGGEGDDRGEEYEMVGWHHWTQWTWVWANSGRW